MTTATRRLVIDAARSGLRMAMKDQPGGLIVYDRALMSQIGLCTLVDWRWEVKRGHDDIAVAYFISCLTREQYPPPRMTFSPKNLMEEKTPLEQVGQIGLNIQRNPELDQLFLNEMKRVRAAAGLRKDMTATGRRNINRLFGI